MKNPKTKEDLTNDPNINPSLHSEQYPFCYDDSCPCHENQENVNTLNDFVLQGLASTHDADNIYRRRTI